VVENAGVQEDCQNKKHARRENMPEMPPEQRPRYVFITPYHKEARDCLERCIASVKQQTIRADHIVVSDGFPQDWLDQANVRHMRLDRAHGDHGNTPRSIGSLMAVAEGYDGIGLLDADCWLEPDHLEHCLVQAEKVGFETCGLVITSRTLRRLDQSVIDVADEPPTVHGDTNCFFFLPPSFGVLPIWALMPRELSSICDRVFVLALRTRNLVSALTTKTTVNYTYTYAPLYRSLGEVPPRPIKENPDHRAIAAWIDALPPKRLELINQRLGANLQVLYRSAPGNCLYGAFPVNGNLVVGSSLA
jgi:glycosyltransferase involved in cell wall biosynthesis